MNNTPKNKNKSEDNTTNNTKDTDITSRNQELLVFELEGDLASNKEDFQSVFTPNKTLARSPSKLTTSTPKTQIDIEAEWKLMQHQNPAVRPRSRSASDAVATDPHRIVIDLDHYSPEQDKKKRKRERNSNAGTPTSYLNQSVKALSQALKELSSYKQDVKSEVKASITNAIKLFNEMQREVKNTYRERSCSRTRRTDQKTHGSLILDISPKNTTTNTCTIGTQTGNPESLDEDELETYNGKDISYNKILPLLDRAWDKRNYKKTVISNSNLLTSENNDLACFIPADLDTENKSIKTIINEFQGNEILAQNPAPGSCTCIVNATCLAERENDKVTGRLLKDKFIFYLVNRLNAQTPQNPEDTYRTLLELRDIAKRENRRYVAMQCEDSEDILRLRKMLEIICLDLEIKIILHSKKTKTENRNNRPGYETVLINKGKMTFAETLKALKSEINVDDEGFQIAGIRSSRQGHVLIDLKGDTEKATSFGNLVNTRVNGARAITGNKAKNKVLHLKQLEADVTIEDIKVAIITSLPETKAESLIIKALRPAFADRQNATLIAPTSIADKLLEGRNLRVGWGWCRVVEREEVTQCYRCREFGHTAKICQGPDRSKLCRRCGSSDHEIKQCENAEKCIICNEEGHRDGSLKCPAYRKALRTRRVEKNKDDKDRNTNLNKDINASLKQIDKEFKEPTRVNPERKKKERNRQPIGSTDLI